MAYHHLTMSDRSIIQHYLEKSYSIRAIARQLGRCASSISREIRRNCKPGKVYSMSTADHRTRRRRTAQMRSKVIKIKGLEKIVVKGLTDGWSPEQIAGRLRLRKKALHISTGSIYRYVRQLKKLYPTKTFRFRRCPAKYRKRRMSAFGPLGKKHISERPQGADLRTEAGHWEGDTIVSSAGNPALLVYVDRKTRYLLMRKVQGAKSEGITRETITALLGAGRHNRKTITLDNGREFAGYRDFQKQLKMQTYFCKPHSPWERPTVENTNGLIRQLTRKKDLRALTQTDVDKLVKLLNNRPRKCLNWRTPAEEFG